MDIRPFQESDRQAIVALLNDGLPWYRQFTAEDMLAEEQASGNQEVTRRLVVSDPAIAFMEVVDCTTSAESQPGVCTLVMEVAPQQRNQGIGSTLFERALAFAHERHAHRIEAWFYQSQPDEPGIPFLQRRGFVEQARRQKAYCNLTTFNAAHLKELERSLQAQGIRFLSYGDLPPTSENRQRLFKLLVATGRLTENAAFENWEPFILRTDWSTNILILAEFDGSWIGLSHIDPFNLKSGVAHTRFTGTLTAYRNRGIATILKARAMIDARKLGYIALTTSNRVDNAPILAANSNVGGFESGPIELTYVRHLRS